MFRKILIADRGEIALRVIRACKELGIATVAVHSEADSRSLHVRFADEDVCIGPSESDKSYRNIQQIISAAQLTNADAIHPGYGPLAENEKFADICRSCGLTFIGPSPEAIALMGDKVVARRTMMEAGVPVVPGSETPITDLEEAQAEAQRIGFPVILKAVAGGGGRGMRVVRDKEELDNAWRMASAEAGAAFTSAALYMERYIERPHHVEIQIIGDRYGTVLHLGERDCSIQRRHQKLIEESPSPVVDDELRHCMGLVAVSGAKRIGYETVGTIEFLLSPDNEFYFIEMNTRIQVEHPVTEFVTEIDLVKEQIVIAAGGSLRLRQTDLCLKGHAIECRINAEDPSRGFAPTPGTITVCHLPGGPGIRVDTHIYPGYEVPPHYDSLLAKLIAYGRTREEAIARMTRALDEFVIEGIPTTIPFHHAVMRDKAFRDGDVTTTYVQDMMQDGRFLKA
jgi:acetyl-CoA carboxylase biotin carboxylase subunit